MEVVTPNVNLYSKPTPVSRFGIVIPEFCCYITTESTKTSK